MVSSLCCLVFHDLKPYFAEVISNLVNWNNPPAFPTGKPASASGHLTTPSPEENQDIVFAADETIPLSVDEEEERRQVQDAEFAHDSEVIESETEENHDDCRKMPTLEMVIESQTEVVSSGDEAPILVLNDVEREKWESEDATVPSQGGHNEHKFEAEGTTDMDVSVLVSEDILEAGVSTTGDDAPGRSIIASSSWQRSTLFFCRRIPTCGRRICHHHRQRTNGR